MQKTNDLIRTFSRISLVTILVGGSYAVLPPEPALSASIPTVLDSGSNSSMLPDSRPHFDRPAELEVETPTDSPLGVPEADADWWAAIQEDIRQSEYQITWQEDTYLAEVNQAYQAPNRTHNIRTYFTPQGIRVIPRVFDENEPTWDWGLKLTRYGYVGQEVEVQEAELLVDGERIEYRRGELTEWYVNDEHGLEQGFTLLKPPNDALVSDSHFVLDFIMEGNLSAHLLDGDELEFHTVGGSPVLRYSGLIVSDAAGRTLLSQMEIHDQNVLRLAFDAAGAIYPITIDPLATGVDGVAESDQTLSRFGFAVSTAGDVDGDGYDDVIVGAPNFDNGETDEGMVFVYRGWRFGFTSGVYWSRDSDQVEAHLGYSVGTAGDVDHDGYSDVIAGAPDYDDDQVDEGRVYVCMGSSSGLTSCTILDGDQDGAHFGFAVGGAGNVNGGSYDDVIIGAPFYDNGETDEGRAYVFFGGLSGVSGFSPWIMESDQAGAYFGVSVGTAGDVNGDGYNDVIVGASSYTNDQVNEGRAFVFHGSTSGPSIAADWTAESNQSDSDFGGAVGTAGDVNGDGYSDIIIGASHFTNGSTDEGRAYVFNGSSSGLSTVASWTAEGDQGYAYYGGSVGTAGDVNADGYSDVIVGAHQYDGGETDEGKAFAYFGSATGLSSSANWTSEANQANAFFGYSVGTAGDVNGDGYDDVIVGAIYFDNDETDEGRIFIYNGYGFGTLGQADWTASGGQSEAEYGWSVGTAGDVNGDGYSDVIIGAPGYDNGGADAGLVAVFYGSTIGLPSIVSWTAWSGQAGAHFGRSVGIAGDVNGDGYSDVVVGAPDFSNGQANEGKIFVYFGSTSGLNPSPDWTVESDVADRYLGTSVGTAGDVNGDGLSDIVVAGPLHIQVFHGSSSGLSPSADWTGSGSGTSSSPLSVGTAGDVNGDGYSDVVIGEPMFGSGSEGRAAVYHGSISGLSSNPDWTAEGSESAFGSSVGTAGDVNGDGYSDVIVGARLEHVDNDKPNEGRAYLYFGSPLGLASSAGWTAKGDQVNAHYGTSVGTAGDVNGDGFSDVIVGAPDYYSSHTSSGRIFVYLGSATGLDTSGKWASSDDAFARMGYSVGTAGDVNGDGFSDVIAGAYGYNDSEIVGGRVFVFHGTVGGISTSPGWESEGDQANANLGRSVGTAGDVNGDGYSDVIVGVPYFDNGETNEGRAYVYHGSASGLSSSPDWTYESEQAYATFGYSVGTAGDVNGDGYSDVIIGAPSYDDAETNEGRAYAFFGSPSGLSTSPDWTFASGQALASLGNSVDTAGDVNGDGYSDVIVGAYSYDNGQTDEGRVYVFHGSLAGLSSSADWTAESNTASALFGWSVGTAGDVNRDGFSDVVVGAIHYTNGQSEEGRAYAYYGSPAGLSPSPDWAVESGQPEANLGTSVGTAGDVNGDGYSDVIVGAHLFDYTLTDEGRASLYYGSASGLSGSSDWSTTGQQAGASLGASVGTAGDVNGDGYTDLIIGAPGYDNDESNEGRAFVYLGSGSGLPSEPDWTAEPDQVNAAFGWSARAAGDVNGDGYGDVVTGAYYYDNGQANEGEAFLYYGNDGDGLDLNPRQYRADGSAPVANLGLSDSGNAIQLRVVGRMPMGRQDVGLQWQAAPLGTSFSSPSAVGGSSDWMDTGTTGVEIVETAIGLTASSNYHWRARLLYQIGNAMGLPASRWFSIPLVSWNEIHFRTPVSPEIDVLGGGYSIIDGDMSPSLADGTDFGDADLVTGSVTHTFSIQNTGAVALNLTGIPIVEIAGEGAADFSVTSQPSTPVASSGGSTTFEITFDPSEGGVRLAEISIDNDDGDENPYNFTIQGTGLAPEMDVLGQGVSIQDGDGTPDVADGTDFGSLGILGKNVAHVFTIENTGALDLHLSGIPIVEILGPHAADFSVTSLPTSPVPSAGGSTTFEITFDPSATGLRQAEISIVNDDVYENPYNFAIQGEGLDPIYDLTVNSTADPGDGICDLSECTLREAVEAIDSGGVITFDPALAGGGILLDDFIRLDKDLTIDGSGLTPHLEVSGGNINAFLIQDGVTVAIDAIDIVGGGMFSFDGGGIAIFDGSTLSLSNCSIVGNQAWYGGGIYNHDSTLEVTQCTFDTNTAILGDGGGAIYNQGGSVHISESYFLYNYGGPRGGAILNTGGGSLTLSETRFELNDAESGGAIYNEDSSLTVVNCTFLYNSASNYGGAIHTYLGTVDVSGSTFLDNRADQHGGGIFNNAGDTTVVNSTFSLNEALSYGGALNNNLGTMTISNSTLSANTASSGGGGIVNASGSTLNLSNTIVAGSPSGGDCYDLGTISANIHNLIEDGSCSPYLSGDPMLDALADNGGPTETMALLNGSPAIDAGDDGTCEPVDQRGISRPQASHCDIGAFELISGLTVNSDADPGDGTCDLSECTLREAIGIIESGGTIIFDPTLDGATILLGSALVVDKDVTLDGAGMATDIQLSGDSSVRILHISAGSMAIDHLDFIDGDTDYGGAIKHDGTALTLSNCTFDSNHSLSGGAIQSNGTLTIADCTFSNNTASDYGGGAIDNNLGSLTVTGSTFRNNSANVVGGAIYNNSGTATLTNSTLTLNSALTSGGAIQNYEGTVTLINSTLSANDAPSGGAILNSLNGTLNMTNSILADSPNGGDCVNDGSLGTNIHNLIEDGTCSPLLVGDPNLGSLANNGGPTQTMVLLPVSDAIDAGDDATCKAADQRGAGRPSGAHCDIGAFEFPSLLEVNSTADPGDGICNTSECTLREAVTITASGDTVSFDPALAGSTITLGSEIGLDKDLTIDGSGLTPHVAVSGGDSVRDFIVSGGPTVAISHLDILDGSSIAGSGIANDPGSTLTLSDCRFDGNHAEDGGAINNNNADLTVVGCSFSNNHAVQFGGAVNNYQGNVTIEGSTFTSNVADFNSGAIFTTGGTLTLANSTVYGNSAPYGGGMINHLGTLTVSNSTVYSNSASINGGGVGNTSGSTLHLLNTIIAGNSSGGDCVNSGILGTNTNNLIEDGTCSPDYSGDPLLGTLADYGGPTQTMALLPGSPAIDAGDDATCEATDQRGVSRPKGLHCDIGAFELEYPYSLYLPLITR